MRRLAFVALLIGLFALPANANDCVETDGTPGIFINTVEGGDASCQTAAEYAAIFSVDNLADTGVLTVIGENPDGTVHVEYQNGGIVDLITSPLDRPVAANPSEFDTAPTVGEVLYDRHPGTGGPQEF